MRFLIDTNILIKLEPEDPANAEADAALAMEINRLIGRGDHSLLVHPSIHHDIERDSNQDRAERTRFLLQKYYELADPPGAEDLADALGTPEVGSNDWVDNQLIAAVLDDLVDFLITEDYGLLRKLGRVARRDKGLNIQEALDVLRSLYDEPLEPPPAVNAVFMHSLDRTDPIWESFREDYPEFDDWFNRARQEERHAWTITPDERLAGVVIVKREEDRPFGLEGRQLKITTFKVADEFVGRKYGELLLKSVFRHANQNAYDGLYVTVLEKYEGLTGLLEDFGFTGLDHLTELGELVLHKHPEGVLEAVGPCRMEHSQSREVGTGSKSKSPTCPPWWRSSAITGSPSATISSRVLEEARSSSKTPQVTRSSCSNRPETKPGSTPALERDGLPATPPDAPVQSRNQTTHPGSGSLNRTPKSKCRSFPDGLNYERLRPGSGVT